MVDLTKEEWYLQYTEDIQEEDFNKLISYLNSLGLKQFDHCYCGLTFEDLKTNGFIRSNLEYASNPNCFCIDNNRQNNHTKRIEIYFKDLIPLINSNIKKEIEIEIW